MMVSALTTLHAQSASSSQQYSPSADTQHTPDTRPDWNVDYPSQLGPQGIITSDAAPAGPMLPHKSHKDNLQTQSP
jgi:hypothetical protein